MDNFFHIFEHLGTNDVISMAKTNKYIKDVVVEYLSNRFLKKLVSFDLSGDTKYSLKFRENDHSIMFYNANDLIKIVLELGLKIQKLEIIMGPRTDNDIENEYILMQIKQNISETLVELRMDGLNTYFKFVEKPFNNVEKLSWSYLDHGVRIVSLDEYKIREHFPALCSLKMTNAPTSTTGLSIPKLECLEISYARGQKTIDFLKANLQIKSLNLEIVDSDILKFIADEMVNVEKLQIFDIDEPSNNNLNFTQLKSITFDNYSQNDKLEVFTFSDKLEEYVNRRYPIKEHIQFLTNNSNVKTLEIIESISSSQIQELISANLGANHLNVWIGIENKPEKVIELINSCKNLDKFTFKVGQRKPMVFVIESYEKWDQEQKLIKHFFDWTFTNVDDDHTYSLTKNIRSFQ